MDADNKERITSPTKQRKTFVSLLLSLIQRVMPRDISGETDSIDEGLRAEGEADIVISDLGGGRRWPLFDAPSRLPNARSWLLGMAAAVVVLGVLSTWLLAFSPWQHTANMQHGTRLLLSATKLGSLYQPAWADDSQYSYAVGSSGNFAACPYQPVTQGGCGKQHLSLVDDGGDLYGWDQNMGKVVKKLGLQARMLQGYSSFSWHWLYPGRYIVSDEQTPGLLDVYQLWDAARGKLLFTANASSVFPEGTAPFVVTSDGWLATFTPRHTVEIWNSQSLLQSSGALFTLSSPYFAHLVALDWSPDGSQLATTSADGTIQIWEPRASALLFRTLHVVRRPDAPPLVTARLVWSPDDQRLASAISLSTESTPIEIWDLQTGHLLQSHSRQNVDPETLTWLDHGVEMLSGNQGDDVQIWNTTTGRVITDVKWQIGATEFMPTDAQLQISSDRRWLILPQTYGVQIIDLQTTQLLHTLPIKNNATLLGITLAPDRTQLATVDQYGQIQIWNIQSGRLITTYQLPVSFVSQVEAFLTEPGSWSVPVGLAWSLDSRMLAATYQGGGLIVLGIGI